MSTVAPAIHLRNVIVHLRSGKTWEILVSHGISASIMSVPNTADDYCAKAGGLLVIHSVCRSVSVIIHDTFNKHGQLDMGKG